MKNKNKLLKKQISLTRRDFLRFSSLAFGGAAAGMFLSSCSGSGTIPAEDESCIKSMATLTDYKPEVSSIWIPKGEHENYYPQFQDLINSATDFSWLKPGDTVLLKIALNSGNPYPMTTDPWLVRCMVRLLMEKGVSNILAGDQSGAEHVVWTATSRRGSSRELCENAGIYDAIVDSGAAPCFFEERIDQVGYENAYIAQTPMGTHHWNNPIYVSSILADVDHIIYLPRVASHIIAGSTMGMKIPIGFLRDDSRLDLHQGGENFYAMYEEINEVPLIKNRLRLIVSSGRQVLRSDGPDTGNVVEPDYGMVLATQDILAHDLLGSAWLESHDHIRSEIIPATPTLANNFLITYSFQEVEGVEDPAPDVPEIAKPAIYCHPSIQNYLDRIGGRPGQIVWNQLNSQPDTALVNNINGMINPV
ncbi:MAG: DUF362 domain-containing protein [Spirochaetes bacterium]|nr:DUF362 domain-containing protein [Spirochaetota bacterium]